MNILTLNARSRVGLSINDRGGRKNGYLKA